MILKYVVKNEIELKDIMRKKFHISNKLLSKLKITKQIFVNEIPVGISTKLKTNDIVTVSFDYEEDTLNVVPTKIDLDIIYEDDYLLIVNKPADIAIHPSNNHYSTSLSNGVRYYFDSLNLKKKTRPVNRLDKGTSGIVIFAKNEYIQEELIKQMKTKEFKKEYIAVVLGTLEHKCGTIDAPIARVPGSIIERYVHTSGDYAITHYEVLKNLENITLVKLILETGRTHQIRVHMKFIGHPIIGDTLYSKESSVITRQALHAYKVTFIHPITLKTVTFTTEIPNDIKKLSKSISRILS